MKSLVKHRDHQYFKDREDHQFLVQIIYSLQVCKLTLYKGAYWFEYPGIHIKAITTPCVSLNDLEDTKVFYKGYPLVKGKIKGWGVTNTPWVYVFWGQVPMKDNLYNFCTMTPLAGKTLGFPCALPDNYFLELDNL